MNAGFSLLLVLAVAAPPAAQEDVRRLPSALSTAVLVDVVVRDGTDRPVTDLTAFDFEVLEDGVVQAVQHFEPPRATAVVPTADVARTEAAASSAPDPTAAPTPSTIAFVFDRLSTEGRVAAQRAARDYLRERGPQDVAGLFSIEGTLVVLQDFTSDPGLVQEAIDALGTRVAQSGSTALNQARASTGTRLAANAAQASLLERGDPTSSATHIAHALAQAAATQFSVALAAADAFERLERDQHGFATANGLTAIVDALRSVPGRKAVVLFSEGLYRTEATEDRFLSVVHAANRASVSVYAVEASGLQVKTFESLAAQEIRSTATLSMAQQASGRDTGGGSMTRELERTEDLVKFHPRGSLEWISNSTGGVFVRDTNDLSGALKRIGSDLGNYYMLGYTPKNESFDGRFRKIAVRVRRKGVEVRARSGYFAVRTIGPVLAHVAPVLALLESGKRPHDVEVFTGAWSFPAEGGPARVPVLVTVPGSAVAKLAARDPKQRLDVTLVARVLSADGQPVDAMSRRFVVDATAAKATGDLCLLRDAWLAPGKYRLEAAAYEAGARRAGVVTADFSVAESARRIDRAQVVIVRGALTGDQGLADLETGHPLRFQDVILQPSAGEPLAKQGQRPLVFQVTVPAAPGTKPPATAAEVWRDDKVVSRTLVQWGPVEAGGGLRHIADLPLAPLAVGPYELRITLTDGAETRTIATRFIVSD